MTGRDLTIQRCVVCRRPAAWGLVIRGRRICPACERRIARSRPGGARHSLLVERLKEIWT